LLSCVLLAGASAFGATQSLNGTWQFTLARDAGEVMRLEQSFHKPEFDAGSFRPIRVPANWAMEGFEEPQYGRMKDAGTGFYLHRFQAPAEWKDRRVLLHFDGVWDSAEVWLNGVNLGGTTAASRVLPSRFRMRSSWERATRWPSKCARPRATTCSTRNDDWSLGGIYRDVWTECMPRERYIDHVDSWVKFDDLFRDADLHIRALVHQTRVAALVAVPYELRATLTAADGRVAGEAVIPSDPHRDTGREHLFKLHVRAPKHWTAETPNLYTLRLELLENGKAAQASEHRVGFREVSTKGGVLRLNGQPIKLRGACRHDEHPDVGIATRREHWLQDLRPHEAGQYQRHSHGALSARRRVLGSLRRDGHVHSGRGAMGWGGDLGVDPSFAGAGHAAHL
jgi:beta-galactosidase